MVVEKQSWILSASGPSCKQSCCVCGEVERPSEHIIDVEPSKRPSVRSYFPGARVFRTSLNVEHRRGPTWIVTLICRMSCAGWEGESLRKTRGNKPALQPAERSDPKELETSGAPLKLSKGTDRSGPVDLFRPRDDN
ncbi:hypothetical protein PHSY_003045 [Pseudozyma hubeiensis SY62]|uniref:Uncharacterized protein n=1 Tax=Pseudozyma hubeiensis (strain SY62) TaxID=1305764 RepID=R9P2I3_PSEHS|nr:hypothetical protein PHSY_003045 [Pseudozyma hubeiensis SY62]GAC95469.1 hypothetical protein PHSY_003045 [Pseudozyma hubeiensis SY62]